MSVMSITVEQSSVDVSTHPAFTAWATSADGRVFTRPAIRHRGQSRAGAKPRADYWVEAAQFVVKAKHTPPYKKCRVTQDGKTKLVSVHRFMLECWDSVRSRSYVVRHLDGDSLNNVLSNLKYGTMQQNVDDAFAHNGNYAEGARNGRAKLTEADVISIRSRFDAGEPIIKIHADYPHVSNVSISNAAKRKTWSHL